MRECRERERERETVTSTLRGGRTCDKKDDCSSLFYYRPLTHPTH